jgi:hypothetical protein
MSSWIYIRENLQTKMPIILKQNPSLNEKKVKEINRLCDPTKDKAVYTPWCARMYSNGYLKPGMLSSTEELLSKFDRYLKANLLQGNDRDINRFKSVDELSSAISSTQDNLVESIPALNKAKQKYSNLYNSQIANLLFADPSGKKGEYIDFLARNMNSGKISRFEYTFFEDVSKIKEALEKFEFLKKRGLIDVDLNSLDLHDVFYYIDEYSQKKPIEKEVIDKMQNLIVGKYEDYVIYKIDKQHSFLLPLIAERTKWCVKQITTTNSYFKFNSALNFFLVAIRNNIPAFLIHYPTLQFKNVLDEPMKQVELGRALLSSVYKDDIMKPWNDIIKYYDESNINEKLNIPFIYNTTDAYINHLCEKEYVINRRTNVQNFRNGYPQIAFLWADFDKIMNADEKFLLKRQLKEYAQSVPERALTPFFERYEKI